ncbi:MAG: ATP-binding protein [Rhodocyclaceae bacterium]
MRGSSIGGGSLRLRLLAGSLLWLLVALWSAGLVLTDLFRDHVTRRFEAELDAHLNQLAAVFEMQSGGAGKLAMPLSDPRFQKPYSGLYWQVDAAGAAKAGLLRSRSLWDSVLIVPKDTPADGELHMHRVRGPDGATLLMLERLIRLDDPVAAGFRLIVAADVRGMSEPVLAFSRMLTIALVVIGVGLAAGALMQVWVGLAPLRSMRSALTAVREGGARRVVGRFPVEVQPLVDELNTVLAHDEERVARARTQAGNLAHAVKTPLTVLANAASRQEGALALLVMEQVSDARRQVDYHLARTRAAVAAKTGSAHTRVRPALEGLVRVLIRAHADRELSIDVSGVSPALVFRGEEQDFQEMLGNLLDNACKWARRNVRVTASRSHRRLILVIEDDGPGVRPDIRDHVLNRGARADEKVPGSGLGLSIVSDLAELYGGDLQLGEAAIGGLKVSLELPGE